ncbi:hypothetical protein HX810_03350 [Pseudomonas salomonii]|uniref:Uncharacterized protein n=1 Tax=Pseudomonas salomonii TaxID=191391 RepID=A0A7Y8GAG8_9PSED|nr:hypothetical protein [Pseudomonas salomonii]NWF06710.1 hypothetical protein [Pseudomonas salomonii]
MDKLLELLNADPTLPLSTIQAIKTYSTQQYLDTHPDTALISHDKHTDKEYFVESDISLHDEYPFLLDATLEDYGFTFEDEMINDLDDGRGLRYKIHSINQRLSRIELRGILSGGYSEMDTVAKCKLSIRAITKKDYKKLDLYESLAIDAYLLEKEGNFKMAFFTYFSAVESIVRHKTDIIKSESYPELQHAIEHLPFGDKIRISGKHTFETDQIATIGIWGSLTKIANDCNTLRNEIAHGLSSKTFKLADAQKAAACYIVVQQALLNRIETMPALVKKYKVNKRR